MTRLGLERRHTVPEHARQGSQLRRGGMGLASFTPPDARAMLPATSLVTVDCSSMAAAIELTISPTWWMTVAML